jgi:hypothetical protein
LCVWADIILRRYMEYVNEVFGRLVEHIKQLAG